MLMGLGFGSPLERLYNKGWGARIRAIHGNCQSPHAFVALTDLAVRGAIASCLYVRIPRRCYIWSTRTNRKVRRLTDDLATAPLDANDYVKSLPLHLRV